MLVGGKSNGQNWYLSPRFFSLNGSLPACLASTKNDIHSSLTKIRAPGIFINKSEFFYAILTLNLNKHIIIVSDGKPVMCVGHFNLDECFEYEVGLSNEIYFH